MNDRPTSMRVSASGSTPIERVYFAWDDAPSRNDASGLLALYAKDAGDAYDGGSLGREVAKSVHEVVRRQVETGIDVVNDGEHSKSSFAHYARTRIGGIERRNEPPRYLGTPTRDAGKATCDCTSTCTRWSRSLHSARLSVTLRDESS